jgi:predicted acetyltransferase
MDGIRQLQKEDLREYLLLSEFAFQYEMSEEEREKRIGNMTAKTDRLWGVFKDGKMTAKLALLPFRTWIGGKEFAMGGIASVSTWPEFRRRGYVADLLRHVLHVMKEQGQTVSFLHPFSFAFYRKYGWEAYCEYKQYEIPADRIPKLPHTLGRVERTEDWTLLNRIYEAYAQTFNGMLVRDEEWWQEAVLGRGSFTSAVWFDESGEPRGYIRYQVKNKEMTVKELVYLDDPARQGLWKFISNHDSMIDALKMTAPADDPLSFLLLNPRFKQEIVPYFMARIVDVAAFLEQYPFAATGKPTSFILHLEDAHAEWNRGSYRVDVNAAGTAGVSRYESSPAADYHREGDAPAPAGLSCDIQSLTAMFLGYRKPTLLHKVGRLQGSVEDVAALEGSLSWRLPYLVDFF